MKYEELLVALNKDFAPNLTQAIVDKIMADIGSKFSDVENKFLSISPENDPKLWVSNDLHMTQDSVKKTADFFRALFSGDMAKIQSSTTTGGGYLIPTEFVGEIFRIVPDYGVFRKNARVIPMKHNTLNMPMAGTTGVTAAWTDEAAAKTESTITYAPIVLTAKKLAGIVSFPDELLEDEAGNPDLVTYLRDLFAEAFAQAEDLAGFLGDGTGTYGSITGIANATGVNVVRLLEDSYIDGFSGATAVRKLLDMQKGLLAGAKVNAKYWMHEDIWNTIKGALTDLHSFVVQQPGGPETAMLWGKPVVSSDSLPTTDAANSPFVWYGNLKNALLGNRKEITATLLKEATLASGINLAEKDAQALRVVERLAITIPDGSAFSVLKTKAS